jgi:ribosomal protein S18 acetylase RimI-like enzyme
MSTTTVTGVRKSRIADTAALAATLTAAFADDPVFGWVLPDPVHRAAVLPDFFRTVVEVLAVHDNMWTTDDTAGAALWVPAGHEVVPAEAAEAFETRMLTLAGPYADRMGEIMALLDEHHPAAPHEYLWFLGVAPRAQGRGLGSALMEPVLRRADRAGLACYLEATSPRNRALYERHGFRVTTEIAVAGGPPLWTMRRPACP